MNSIKEEIAKNLAFYRKRAGLTQKELAEKLGLSHNSISSWENGKNSIDIETLFEVCEILGVTINDMYGGMAIKDATITVKERELLDSYRSLTQTGKNFVTDNIKLVLTYEAKKDSAEESNGTYTSHPIYLLPASAGTGQFLDGENFEMVTFPTKEIPKGSNFGVRVSGSSMEPQLHDGDVAFIQRSKEIQSGNIGVFILNGDAYIKKMVCDMDECYLVSLNPAYEPIKINKNDDLRTVGKVLWID